MKSLTHYSTYICDIVLWRKCKYEEISREETKNNSRLVKIKVINGGSNLTYEEIKKGRGMNNMGKKIKEKTIHLSYLTKND